MTQISHYFSRELSARVHRDTYKTSWQLFPTIMRNQQKCKCPTTEIDPSKASVLEMHALLSYKDYMNGNEAGVQNMASWKLNSFREAYDYRIVSTNYADIKECLNEKSNWIELNDAAKESLKEIEMLESDKVTETQWHEIFNDYLTKIFDRIKEEQSERIEKLFEDESQTS